MDELKKTIIFVGLGNPGKQYELTRHNMGYIVLQAFAKMHGAVLKEDKKFFAKVGKVRIGDWVVHMLLPTTYMNESGRAVRSYMDYFALAVDQLVVITDDVELPFGKLRLRKKGSCGGHNGLLSVERELGDRNYPRFRIGIGRQKEQGKDLSRHVLGAFNKYELDKIPEILDKAINALLLLMQDSIDNVMNKINVGDQVKKEEDTNK